MCTHHPLRYISPMFFVHVFHLQKMKQGFQKFTFQYGSTILQNMEKGRKFHNLKLIFPKFNITNLLQNKFRASNVD